MFWNGARLQMALISLAGFALFVFCFPGSRIQNRRTLFSFDWSEHHPGAVSAGPMLHVDDVELRLICRYRISTTRLPGFMYLDLRPCWPLSMS